MSTKFETVQDLVKALEAGSYGAAPQTLVQGSALQIESLDTMMHNVCFEDKALKLQKVVGVEGAKTTTVQFNRELSYGRLGGSAHLEGNVGPEKTGDYVRVTVPMCFYSHTRRVTLASTMVDTVDGKKSDERQAVAAAKTIAADIEFDLFRGCDDFSNAGVFDGHIAALPSVMANMRGVGLQIRQSDSQRNAKDLMFGAFGSDDSVVLASSATLTQDLIEDSHVRSVMNHGQADVLYVDPKVLANYNKITFGKERIILAGAPQPSTGADLKRQAVSGGEVSIESSRFLSGRTGPDAVSPESPAAPASVSAASVTDAASPTQFVAGQVYKYFVATGNEMGHSRLSAEASATVAANQDVIDVTITHPSSGVARWFDVYRTPAGGAAASAKYIGRVAISGSSSTVFRDLGNKQPGFVTGFLLQADTMEMKELAPYSRLKLAQTDLSVPEAHFRFCTLAVYQPRKNVILDNLR